MRKDLEPPSRHRPPPLLLLLLLLLLPLLLLLLLLLRCQRCCKWRRPRNSTAPAADAAVAAATPHAGATRLWRGAAKWLPRNGGLQECLKMHSAALSSLGDAAPSAAAAIITAGGRK